MGYRLPEKIVNLASRKTTEIFVGEIHPFIGFTNALAARITSINSVASHTIEPTDFIANYSRQIFAPFVCPVCFFV